MEAQMFRLTGNGLEKMEAGKEFPIGMRIYSVSPSGDYAYCVTSSRDERGLQEACIVGDYRVGNYFSPIHTIDKYTRPISKKFGIGFYWDDKENFIYSTQEVENFKAKALKEEHEIELRVLEEKEADKRECERLPKQYPYLKVNPKDYKEFRANIAADLKHHFPDMKFSIKKESYDCIYIRWTDGVTKEQVTDIKHKWVDHKTDFTGDYRDYEPSNFNRVFGGKNYIFLERDMSQEVEKLRDDLKEMRVWDERDILQTFHDIFCKTSIPASAQNLRIEKTDITSGQLHELYRIAFDVPEKVIAEQIEIDGIELIDYSEKAIAVIGDTKPIKDQLKELGGRFNFRLSCGAGWIFPKTKKEEVMKLLSN